MKRFVLFCSLLLVLLLAVSCVDGEAQASRAAASSIQAAIDDSREAYQSAAAAYSKFEEENKELRSAVNAYRRSGAELKQAYGGEASFEKAASFGYKKGDLICVTGRAHSIERASPDGLMVFRIDQNGATWIFSLDPGLRVPLENEMVSVLGTFKVLGDKEKKEVYAVASSVERPLSD